MRPYEAVYILDPLLSEDQANELKDKVSTIITQSEGTMHEVRYWGKRRFAYPIEKKREGHYFLFIFDAEESVPLELSHFTRVTEDVMRSMIFRRNLPKQTAKARKAAKKKAAIEATLTPIEPAPEPVEVEEQQKEPLVDLSVDDVEEDAVQDQAEKEVVSENEEEVEKNVE